jgi:hypothetical protein
MIDNDGDDIDFGFDEGGLDLSFGDDTPADPADLNLADMAPGTTGPNTVTTDLSGTPAKAPVTAPTPTPQQPATQQPGQQPATPPAPAAAATPAPAQTPPTAEQPGATEQPQPAVSIEEFVSQNADAILSNLASSHFAIPNEEATALGFSPEVKAWIEKRDAKNYLLTMVQTNNALQQTLPHVVASLMQGLSAAKQTTDGFYGEFEDLRDPKYTPHLRELAKTLRSVNPQMDKAQFQTLLGTTARTMFGLPTPAPKVTQQNGRNVRRGRPQPFTPAGATQPQRNMGGNGQPQMSGLEFMAHAIRTDLDG